MTTQATHPNPLKVIVDRQRTMFGKLGQYVALLGGFNASGTTKEEALGKLEQIIIDAVRHAYVRRYLVLGNGITFALYHVPGGSWCYDIIHVDGSASTCGMSTTNERDAFEQMKSHFEQMKQDLVIAA